MLAKLKAIVKARQYDIILVIAIVLISLLSFAAGYLVAREQLKESIQIISSDCESK